MRFLISGSPSGCKTKIKLDAGAAEDLRDLPRTSAFTPPPVPGGQRESHSTPCFAVFSYPDKGSHFNTGRNGRSNPREIL